MRTLKQVSIAAMGLAIIATTGCLTPETSEAGGQASLAPAASHAKAGAGNELARYERPGFVVKMDDGRLWVFKEGAKELADFEAHGELAKHVIRPAAGPGRITIKAPDAETADAYLPAVK